MRRGSPSVLARVLLIGIGSGILPPAAFAQTTDPFEGLVVREIRVAGFRGLTPEAIQRHLATRAGEPFRSATLEVDRRRLDERTTSAEARFSRNWSRGLRTGVTGDVLALDAGSSGATLSADG